MLSCGTTDKAETKMPQSEKHIKQCLTTPAWDSNPWGKDHTFSGRASRACNARSLQGRRRLLRTHSSFLLKILLPLSSPTSPKAETPSSVKPIVFTSGYWLQGHGKGKGPSAWRKGLRPVSGSVYRRSLVLSQGILLQVLAQRCAPRAAWQSHRAPA